MVALTIIGFYLQGKKDKRLALERINPAPENVVAFPSSHTHLAIELLNEYHTILELDPKNRIIETDKWQKKAKAWNRQNQQQAVR